MRETVITNCEKKFLIKCLSEWTRLDRRAFDEFRPLQIDFGKDLGSCCVSLGKTRVLAQTSCEIQPPKSSRPSEGILNINIELNPIAAPHFEAGRQSNLSVQLNRLLEKCIKDSKAVDLESLCIKTSEKVWALRVDINVLNHEGNILDCASVAALASLAHFRRPDVTCDGEEFIIHSYEQRDPIPTVIHHYPICLSYCIFNGGEFILADPTLLEEGVADAVLTIGLNGYRELCGLHLGGKAELTPDTILATVNKATLRANSIIEEIKNAIKTNIAAREKRQHISFQNSTLFEKSTSQDLRSCLDQWQEKGKRKHFKNKNQENLKQQEGSFKVELHGKGSAAYVPENGGKWETVDSSDDDKDDVMVVEVPVKKEEPVLIENSDSEEEEGSMLKTEM